MRHLDPRRVRPALGHDDREVGPLEPSRNIIWNPRPPLTQRGDPPWSLTLSLCNPSDRPNKRSENAEDISDKEQAEDDHHPLHHCPPSIRPTHAPGPLPSEATRAPLWSTHGPEPRSWGGGSATRVPRWSLSPGLRSPQSGSPAGHEVWGYVECGHVVGGYDYGIGDGWLVTASGVPKHFLPLGCIHGVPFLVHTSIR